jgi:hypothetical protein
MFGVYVKGEENKQKAIIFNTKNKNYNMLLFTKEIDKKLAAQYHLGADLNAQVVVAKIFNPYGNGRWYLINSDPSDPDYLWAIVQIGDIVEVGSVSRKELENLRVGRLRFPLERDLGFSQRNAQEVYNGVISGKTYAKGGMADVTPTYAAGGEISPETLTKFAEDLQQAESEAYDNLDIRSGGQLYRTPSLQKQYASAMNQAFAELTKKHAHLKDINVENGQTIYDYLEDQNYHSLNNYLALRGVFGTKYKQKYEGYHTKYPENYLDPANMVGAQSYAVGGLTPGRWYKDNQGVEYKFIGKIDNGPNKDQLLFTDGTQKTYKTIDEFGGAPKENKLFGFFAEGGEIDLFEHYEDIPPHVKKVLDKYNEGLEEGDYEALKKAKNELESIGYTFDYDLGGGAYNLHKMEEGDSMSGYMADGGKLNIGTIKKTDTDVLFDKKNGTFYVNVIDGGGNRVNKIDVNTIDDVFAKYPTFRLNTKGEKEFPESMSVGGFLLGAAAGAVATNLLSNRKQDNKKSSNDDYYDKSWKEKLKEQIEYDGFDDAVTDFDEKTNDKKFETLKNNYLVGTKKFKEYIESKNLVDTDYDISVKDAIEKEGFDYALNGYNDWKGVKNSTFQNMYEEYKKLRLQLDNNIRKQDNKMADGGLIKEIKLFEKYNYPKPKTKGDKVRAIFEHFEKKGYTKDEINKTLGDMKYADGGKVKFADKVKSIQASLLKRKKVAPSVQKDYGKTYNKAEAKEAATRITGAMTAKERLMAKKKK